MKCIHSYTEQSAHNPEECPYCLKRQGKHLHVNVVASIVCPGKIKFPIYCYRIHARSPDEKEQLNEMSEKRFKQECEQSALKHVLGAIRHRFPRLPFRLLLDALYANAPMDPKSRWISSSVHTKKLPPTRTNHTSTPVLGV